MTTSSAPVSSFLLMTPWEAQGGSSSGWVPDTHMADSGKVLCLGSPGPVLVGTFKEQAHKEDVFCFKYNEHLADGHLSTQGSGMHRDTMSCGHQEGLGMNVIQSLHRLHFDYTGMIDKALFLLLASISLSLFLCFSFKLYLFIIERQICRQKERMSDSPWLR